MRSLPPRHGSRNIRSLVALTGMVLLGARPARAADLPGARLTVSRTPAASACTDEDGLARDLRARMANVPNRPLETLVLSVDLSSEGELFVATVRVAGRKVGVRTLRSNGPGCESLYEALMVSLLLLLDADPAREEPPAPLSSEPPPAIPAGVPPGPPASSPNVESAPRPSFWIGAGGAVTHGFPERWSGAAFADLTVRWKSFDLSVGGAFAPKHAHALAEGRDIVVSLEGARARGCYAFWENVRGLRLGGCALAVVTGLRGEGRGSAGDVTAGSAQPTWWLFGAGPDVFVPLSPRLGIGIYGAVLAEDKRESFYIQGVEGRYDTDSIVGWLGLDLRLRIW
jgi:hypothetical protein